MMEKKKNIQWPYQYHSKSITFWMGNDVFVLPSDLAIWSGSSPWDHH